MCRFLREVVEKRKLFKPPERLEDGLADRGVPAWYLALPGAAVDCLKIIRGGTYKYLVACQMHSDT